VVLVCGLIASTGNAEPADDSTSAGSTTPYGIPPWPVDSINSVPMHITGGLSDITATASKPKLTVNLPPLQVLVYSKYCIYAPWALGPYLPGFDMQSCCPDPFDTSTCPKEDIVQAPEASPEIQQSGELSWTREEGPVYIRSPKGAVTKYGILPPVKVHTVAFGSVPVTATIHITQPMGADGFRQGLESFYVTSVGRGFTLDDSLEGWGSPPQFTRGNVHTFFALPAHVTGPVDIRISDVTVDGRPLEVGPDCHTATPGQLTMKQEGGFYDGDSDPNDRTLNPAGSPGAWRALSGKSWLPPGDVSIPSFTGCRNGSEDLDPLLNGIVSSPHNEVHAWQVDALNTCEWAWDPNEPQVCGYPYTFESDSKNAKITGSTRTMKSTMTLQSNTTQPKATQPNATMAKLTPAQRSRLVSHLKSVLATMPPQPAAYVRDSLETKLGISLS